MNIFCFFFRINYLTVILFFFIKINLAHGQKEIIKYKYYIDDNISYNKALLNAIAESKTEALKKAGLSENISNYTALISSESKDDFTEFFRAEILVSINGAIKDWKYLSPPKKGYDAKIDQFYIDLHIETKVLKYHTKPDPKFAAKIDGLKTSYISGDDKPLDLKIIPYQNCYLKVFYISDSKAQVIYPIETKEGVEKPKVFENNQLIKEQVFKIDYLYPETEKENEFGKFIIVITKENIPYSASKVDDQGFYTNTSIEDIFEWILSIEPNNRKEYYQQFIISY